MENKNDIFVDPEKAGHWDGDTFVFNETVEVPVDGGGTVLMSRLDTSTMELAEGITRDDVILAILNPQPSHEIHVDQTLEGESWPDGLDHTTSGS